MIRHIPICLAWALVFGLSPSSVFAVPFTEVGDAGDVPGTAQTTLGVGPLTAIVGTIGSDSDQDMFQIFISEPAAFSASTVNAGTTLSDDDDTQLFLFDATGLGELANDNKNGTAKSLIPAGSFAGATGFYFLAISIFDNDPINAGGEIFPDTPFEAVLGPTGPGGATKRNPRRLSSRLMASDSGVTAGSSPRPDHRF